MTGRGGSGAVVMARLVVGRREDAGAHGKVARSQPYDELRSSNSWCWEFTMIEIFAPERISVGASAAENEW